MTHPGLYYDGEHARAIPVSWSVAGGCLQITGPDVEYLEPLATLNVGSRVGHIRRVIYLPDGSQLHSDDNDAVDRAFPRHGIEAFTDRLERHWIAVFGSLFATVAGTVLFFTVGLPWLADRVARVIPPEVEEPIGAQVMAMLDGTVFSESTLDPDVRNHFLERFRSYVTGIAGSERYRLEFRYMEGHRANAFAIPGGTIVFTDALVELIGHDEEFLAIAAHEVGHQQERHVLRSVLQQSALIVLGTVLTGDISAATGVTVAVPTFLLGNHYSRKFESQADEWAFDSLRARDISPAWFARSMLLLSEDADGEHGAHEESPLSYVSTHPPTAARIYRALDAAAGMTHPGMIIARREAVAQESRRSSGAPAMKASPEALVGCWENGSAGADQDGDAETEAISRRWKQQTASDGTLRLQIDFDAGNGQSITETYQGYWALEGATLVEHILYEDTETGIVSQLGHTMRHRLRAVSSEKLSYYNVHDGELIEARRTTCPGEP